MTKIGFIGAGGVAGVHRKAIELVDDAVLSAVYDTSSVASASMAKVAGAKACDSVDELLDNCDAAYILTPPHSHRDLIIRALKAGKHVMCEKPLAISLEDGYVIRNAVAASKRKFMIGFSMRFRESNQRLKSIYDSGALGTPLTFWFQRMFGGSGYDPENWRYRLDTKSGMSVESLSHQIDLVRWIFGEIDTVYAKVIASHPELPDVDNNIHAIFTLNSGVVATLHVSWSSQLAFNTTGINGTDGTVRILGADGANHDVLFQRFDSSGSEEKIELDEKYDEKIMAAECRGFLDLINDIETDSPKTGFPGVEEGLRALEISHAILTSSRESRVVITDQST